MDIGPQIAETLRVLTVVVGAVGIVWLVIRATTQPQWRRVAGFVCPACGPVLPDDEQCCDACGAECAPQPVLVAFRMPTEEAPR